MAHGTPASTTRSRPSTRASGGAARRRRSNWPSCERRYAAIGGRLAAHDAHRGTGRRRARRARARGHPAATWCRSAPSTPTRSSRRPPPSWRAAGVERVVGLVLTPHGSSLGSQEYLERARGRARATTPVRAGRHRGSPTRRSSRSWPPACRTRSTVVTGRDDGDLHGALPARADAGKPATPIPSSWPSRPGSSPTAAGLDDWLVAWQSAGRTPEPWLGPDVRDVVRQLAADDCADARRGLSHRVRVRPPRGALRPRRRSGRRRRGGRTSPTPAPHRSTTTLPSSPRWPTDHRRRSARLTWRVASGWSWSAAASAAWPRPGS